MTAVVSERTFVTPNLLKAISEYGSCMCLWDSNDCASNLNLRIESVTWTVHVLLARPHSVMSACVYLWYNLLCFRSRYSGHAFNSLFVLCFDYKIQFFVDLNLSAPMWLILMPSQ